MYFNKILNFVNTNFIKIFKLPDNDRFPRSPTSWARAKSHTDLLTYVTSLPERQNMRQRGIDKIGQLIL